MAEAPSRTAAPNIVPKEKRRERTGTVRASLKRISEVVMDVRVAWPIVLLVLVFVGPIEGKRFVDVSENSIYWNFVVVIWLMIYAVIYIAPRVMN